LKLAEMIGPRRVLEELERLQASNGAAYAPAPLLRRAAEEDIALRELGRYRRA
jgi:hypothetical protein